MKLTIKCPIQECTWEWTHSRMAEARRHFILHLTADHRINLPGVGALYVNSRRAQDTANARVAAAAEQLQRR